MGYCRDCRFRDAETQKSGKSLCVCPKLTSDSYESKEFGDDDSLIYSYDEGGGFYVGENFGCVHWTPIPNDQVEAENMKRSKYKFVSENLGDGHVSLLNSNPK